MSNQSITADKTPWYQWDTGLTVTVSGGAMTECHFANRKQGTAYVQAVINGVARVPDELLQVAAPIKAYGYVSDGAGGQTYVEQSFEVIARNIPSDYTYTKTAQKTIRDAEAARDQAVQAAKDSKASELAADDSAVEASNSAQSAGESASAAANSASNAAKSAGDAAKSASDAKAAASKTVEDASELLKTYTDKAKTSADNAATSASNAADSASDASGSASAAAQSATDASNAKVAAQTAKAEAETAKSEAATSASNAATSAENAANSARDAANSVNSINVIAPKTVNVPASSSEQFDIAIGQNAKSEANQSIAIGVSSVASHLSSIALGGFAETSKDYEVAIGTLLENGVDVTREITHVTAPTGPNSAATKQYTDDNDAKTLSEAKKYTDANTSNALVGTVSGKLLHVEDAWPGKPLSLTIDGAYKQDGTPSPEAPVPITVVRNMAFEIIGSNGVDLKSAYYRSVSGTKRPEFIDNGVVFNVTNNDERFLRFNAKFIAGTTVILTCDYEIESGTANRLAAYIESTKQYIKFGVPETITKDASYIDLYVDANETASIRITNIQLSYVNRSNYRPYTSSTLPITLPSEHPYMAALPDGTHDEIVIDKYGNASLTAIVGKTETAATDGVNATVGTDALSSTGAIADGATVYYKLAKPVTYSLGKLDIPSLPETISNAWIEATLTPEMSMDYKRDINIAFDNLVQAVVAAAAGE